MKIIIATIKSWNIEHANKIKNDFKGQHQIEIIDKKEKLNLMDLEKFKPDFIFFPHWSYIIPKSIYEKYECVVFHMTDLPFGRGGSPLQNLIVRGIYNTKISALRVEKELDAGPVYMKENLDLLGSAEEIYRRASDIIFRIMIPKFLKDEKLRPEKQQGEPVYFKRRRPDESELKDFMSLQQIYDYIRMLDAEGYPKAYLKLGNHKISFKNAAIKCGKVYAEVEMEE